MKKRMLASVSAVAIMAALFTPAISLAKDSENENKSEHKLSAPIAIDGHGDSNGLARFKKHSENRRIKQVTGTVTAITAPAAVNTDGYEVGTITVMKGNGTSYTFNYDSTSTKKYTTFLRKYKGTATWNEIMVGDSVHVFVNKLVGGKAVVVWDKGIWYAEVKGVVSNLNTTTMAFTLTVTKGGIEYTTTGHYDAMTIFMLKDGTMKTAADLANGQTVKIRGAWDAVGKFLLSKRIVIYPTI